jgi:hypothetical protein
MPIRHRRPSIRRLASAIDACPRDALLCGKSRRGDAPMARVTSSSTKHLTPRDDSIEAPLSIFSPRGVMRSARTYARTECCPAQCAAQQRRSSSACRVVKKMPFPIG